MATCLTPAGLAAGNTPHDCAGAGFCAAKQWLCVRVRLSDAALRILYNLTDPSVGKTNAHTSIAVAQNPVTSLVRIVARRKPGGREEQTSQTIKNHSSEAIMPRSCGDYFVVFLFFVKRLC
jgi:hypothetical protein